MPRLTTGLAMALGLGCALTVAISWPVLWAPSELIFGHEIVGRQHDAYTVIQQMATTGTHGAFAQPLTDRLGWLLARVLHPVAAYNVLILLTFPLTVAATYALARYLFASHAGALFAGVVFAFAPLHLAHAAYHPHIAQTQWLPLYLLAVFALVDRPSWARAGGAAAAAAALVLSNDYAGLIGAVMTPVAVVVYWWASPRGARAGRRLALALGALALMGAAGLAAIALEAPQIVQASNALAFEVSDVALFSARWWAYFVPPVDHPLLGPMALSVHASHGVTQALLEEQVFISYGLLVLAAAAVAIAFRQRRSDPAWRTVVALVAIAAAAALISIGPGAGDCGSRPWVPACLLYRALPMFRSYARFAFVTHLAISIAAGCGVAWMARRSRAGTTAAVLACAVVAFEYWPLPWRAHDVLPTAAHRWLVRQGGAQRTLDCTPGSGAEASLPWLMQREVSPLNDTIATCANPHLGAVLSAQGYTHAIVRSERRAIELPGGLPPGLVPAAQYPDATVYRVTAPVPPIATIRAEGFFAYEYSGARWWRWMGPEGAWTVRNSSSESRTVSLALVLESLAEARTLTVALDGAPASILHLGTTRASYLLGPWTMAPGDHTLAFTASGPPWQPSAGGQLSDTRLLSAGFWREDWIDTPVKVSR